MIFRVLKRACLFLLVAVFLLIAILSAVNIHVISSTREDIVSGSDKSHKSYDCILVLGAGVNNNSTPSPMLADRLDVAIHLYLSGYSNTVFLSGDRSGDDYDEVAVMRSYCIERGVLESDIVCDNFGYSTYESLNNLCEYNSYNDVIIVTQRYHLYRAIFIAEAMGIEVDGVSATTRAYRGQNIRDVREGLARFKDALKLVITE